MFELNAALREWRRTASRYPMSTSELDELEDHLCTSYLANCEHGKTPGEAFAMALRSLGAVGEVSAEYRKVRSLSWVRLLKVSWAAFAAAFFLPVVDGGITLPELNLGEGMLPGFQAVWVAMEEGGWSMFSAVTNVLLLATMWRVRDLGRFPITMLALAVSGAVLLNGWWLTDVDLIADLRIGYYFWWASFGLASSALVMRVRQLARRSDQALLA